MEETRWWRYLSGLMGEETATEAARRSGISSSNFTRWKKGARADPDFVVKIARAYETNVLKALVEAEFITEEEANLRELAPVMNLQDISADALLEELQRRVDRFNFLKNLGPNDEPDMTVDDAIDELSERRRHRDDLLVASDYPENVMFAVPPESLTPEQREYLRRANKTTPGVVDGGYGDGMPDDAVAYGHDEVGGTPDDFEP